MLRPSKTPTSVSIMQFSQPQRKVRQAHMTTAKYAASDISRCRHRYAACIEALAAHQLPSSVTLWGSRYCEHNVLKISSVHTVIQIFSREVVKHCRHDASPKQHMH